MEKFKLCIVVCALFLLFSCSMDYSDNSLQEVEQTGAPAKVEKESGEISSAVIKTKVVTVTRNVTRRIHETKVTMVLGAISRGSESTYYNDGLYKGTIKSVSFSVTGPHKVQGKYVIFPLRITYKGTVTARIIPPPKSVTVTRTISKSIPPNKISEVFGSISRGYLSHYYTDRTHKGTIKSTGFRVLGPPTTSGNLVTFRLSVTYKGTVYGY